MYETPPAEDPEVPIGECPVLNFYTSIPAGAVISTATLMFGTTWKMETFSHNTYNSDGKPIAHMNYHQKNDIWQAPVNGVAQPVPKPYNALQCGQLFVYRLDSNPNLWKIYKLG